MSLFKDNANMALFFIRLAILSVAKADALRKRMFRGVTSTSSSSSMYSEPLQA